MPQISNRNPFSPFVSRFAQLLHEGATIGPASIHSIQSSQAAGPKALLFSPHPDDECITGGLPLRLLRELRMKVINVAVTLGSTNERQGARWGELTKACEYIGFDLLLTAPIALEGVSLHLRNDASEAWSSIVNVTAEILLEQNPFIIFMPHEDDSNTTHISTHHLVMDALHQLPFFQCLVSETEYWNPIKRPNLMVESSIEDVSDLVAALSLHVGEVARNPYHLRLPAWMMDNVRRGTELVLGQGSAAPAFTFATIYKLREWRGGKLKRVLYRGRLFSQWDDLSTLFA